MIPVVTPAEMAEVDARAADPVEVLIERAGAAVAWHARRLLGGTYGRRIAVLAGPGNNGADGRVAARRLRGWGAQVIEVVPDTSHLPAADLVIDAAYGTGLSRPYAPPPTHAPVLAVDIPSGVNGLTGEVPGGALPALETVTFQALKPGLVFPPGATFAGTTTVVDLGLDVSTATVHVVTAASVRRMLPDRPTDAHKWKSACWVIAGSPGMLGAAVLASSAAARAGAGYVRLGVPGGSAAGVPAEIVSSELPAEGWGSGLHDLDRFGSVVIGPGLGRSPGMTADVVTAAAAPVPLVIDGDGLSAIAESPDVLVARAIPAVLTPHDGEYHRLAGEAPGPDRIDSARNLASATNAVVLLKGPTTVIADPDGRVRLCAAGDQRLATAGSGDVLSGIIGALLAQGLEPYDAATAGAWLHGRAATLAPDRGMVASDLLATLPEALHASDLG